MVFLTSTFLLFSSGFRDLTLELQSEPRRARVTRILARGQNITRAEVVGEGWGLEIVLWRGFALYPAGVWMCVHKYVCIWMFVCVFMWVTVYMCEGVCVCVSECLHVYYCMCVSLCVYVWVCVCECLYVYYWMYESVCVCGRKDLFLWARSLKRCGKVLEDLNTFLTPLQRSSRYPAVTQWYGWQWSLLYSGGNTLASGNWPIILQAILSIFHEDTTFSDPLETRAWKR